MKQLFKYKVSLCPIVKTLMLCTYDLNLFIYLPPNTLGPKRDNLTLYRFPLSMLLDTPTIHHYLSSTSVITLEYILNYISINKHVFICI